MINKLRPVTTYSCGLCLALLAINFGVAALGEEAATNRSAEITPFVNEDTFAVAYVNLAALPKADAANVGKIMSLLPPLGDNAQPTLMALQGFGGMVENVRAAGVDAVYVVVGLQDVVARGGPLVIFHLEKKTKPDAAFFALKGLVGAAAGSEAIDVRLSGAELVLVGRATTLDRYASLAKSDRPDLVKPLNRLAEEGAVVAAVVCPGPDARRVVRELWPTLPGRLAPLTGEYADRWLHVELAVNSPPDTKLRLALEARDAEAAALFAKLFNDLPGVTAELGGAGEQREKIQGFAQQLVEVLPARTEGIRVVIEMPTDEGRITKLRSMIAETSVAAMESSRRKVRMEQLRELTVAMNNYYDTNKHLPPPAICDKEGLPLLSWRVAVLQFMDSAEQSLYKQFHLDEPWDSPHNRTLIEKMPRVYADPQLKQLARAGKTTYQVPVGPETIFYQKEGTSFRDVKDGTSKTIMLVEVEPSRAVEWTKPEDWEVDSRNPRQGLARTDRNYFTAGYADTHASIIKANADESKLRAALTRAGGEAVDLP